MKTKHGKEQTNTKNKKKLKTRDNSHHNNDNNDRVMNTMGSGRLRIPRRIRKRRRKKKKINKRAQRWSKESQGALHRRITGVFLSTRDGPGSPSETNMTKDPRPYLRFPVQKEW